MDFIPHRRYYLYMKKIITAILILSVILISSCATPLAGIKSKPSKYAGMNVTINAYIELEVPIPFMDYSLYRISDDSDKMFLFTDKKYRIGEKIFTKVHVIGITEKNSKTAADDIAKQTADFLVDHKIAGPAKALSFSRKIVRLISTLGSMAEGSYFLIAK